MTIDKLPSGNYRIREMRNGKVSSVIVDHEPGKKEAKELIEAKLGIVSDSTPFIRAAETYIQSKSNILSPSSIRGYKQIVGHLPENFLNAPLNKINKPTLQILVNQLSSEYAPKTVRNTSAFVMSVLKFFDIEVKSPSLPKKEAKIDYIPTEDDIKRILFEVQGTKYEVPFVLGTLGLRRSEICALTKEDLNGNVLTINKALVLNENNEWTLKHTTKTDKSTRAVIVPEYIAELIRKDGACPCTPHSLYWKLQRVQMKLGIPRFPFHKLRHFFASYLHENGFTDKQIQEMGGWATGNIMKSVYQHAMSMDSAKSEASNLIGNLVRFSHEN